MVKVAEKKQKLLKKPDNANKKILKKTKKKKIKADKSKSKSKSKSTISSDSEGDQNSAEEIQKLLEPYTKDQLIELIIDAAVANLSLYTRIRDAADRDVSHRKIFVYGLGWDTTKETLTSAFKPYGEIEDCNVVIDRVTGKAKGFGFVQFKSRKAAMKALKDPRKKIGNRTASCQLASLGPAAAGTGSADNTNRKIYVGNVPPDADPDRLRAFFSKFGEIETGPIGFDSSTGKSRGFALFVYKNQQGFKNALDEPHKLFEGHQLHCQKAADGKNKGTTVAAPVTVTAPVVQQPTPQVLAAVASQNFALFSQHHPGLNPMYGGLFPNQNAGLLAANPLYASGVLGQVGAAGSAPTGLGSYYAGAPHGLSIGGDNGSSIGEYGGSGRPLLQGVGAQHAYPNKKVGQSSASGSRSLGAPGSFSGYPSHL